MSSPAVSAVRLRGDLFPWVLALATGLDYFDNAIFSFFASYIAGGVNASPDELVWSSSAYAVAAVLGILQQQWWVERLGHRRYIAGCLLLYAAGAAMSALSDSSWQLMFTRGFQGYFIGPMMGACRILIQSSFAPQQRASALRSFLAMIILSSALAAFSSPTSTGARSSSAPRRPVSPSPCSRSSCCPTPATWCAKRAANPISGRICCSRSRRARCKS
jgi:MFS family permease